MYSLPRFSLLLLVCVQQAITDNVDAVLTGESYIKALVHDLELVYTESELLLPPDAMDADEKTLVQPYKCEQKNILNAVNSFREYLKDTPKIKVYRRCILLPIARPIEEIQTMQQVVNSHIKQLESYSKCLEYGTIGGLNWVREKLSTTLKDALDELKGLNLEGKVLPQEMQSFCDDLNAST